MSGIAALVGGARADESLLRGLRSGLERRGADHFHAWSRDAATLLVSRFDWELDDLLAGRTMIAERDGLAVAADASLYERERLHARLLRAGAEPRSLDPAELILAAYRCWDENFVEELNGDFACLVWDGGRQCLLAVRDIVGSRPLYYARLPDGLVVASSIDALVHHPQVSDELNLVAIASTLGGLFGVADETCYAAISTLPAGSALVWEAGRLEVGKRWMPRREPELARLRFADAAEELRERLGRAVAARMDAARPTTVWLSGGHDSTAIFAAGEMRLQREARGRHLHAVSVSYPPGDSGREDELIQSIVDHWGSPVRWMDIRTIPLLDRPVERAAEREEPYAHAFEMWNRALAAGSRAEGARVAFTGFGGDALFKVSPVYLADLLRRGAFRELLADGRALGFRGPRRRALFTWALKPWLPLRLLRAADGLLAGRPVHRYLERRPPPWIEAGFAKQHRLLRREQRSAPQRETGSTHADAELLWYLHYAYSPRVYAAVHAFGLEAGIDVRAPLLDESIISFALSRPVSDRAARGENKRILRAAVWDLLPEEIVRPRRKTGTTGTYFDQSFRKDQAQFVRQVLHTPVLAELGLVERQVLREQVDSYLAGRNAGAAFHLFLTLQTELWVRARLQGRDRPASPPRPDLVRVAEREHVAHVNLDLAATRAAN